MSTIEALTRSPRARDLLDQLIERARARERVRDRHRALALDAKSDIDELRGVDRELLDVELELMAVAVGLADEIEIAAAASGLPT